MYKKILFLGLSIISAPTILHAKSKPTNVKRLKLRVGDTKEVKGYSKVTADPKSAVHIYREDENHIAITGKKSGMVDLDFYDEDGEKIASKSLYIKEQRPEPEANVSFGFGVGGGYPYPVYYSSDPFYDPLYGWWAAGPYWGDRWGWHGNHHHHGRRCR